MSLTLYMVTREVLVAGMTMMGILEPGGEGGGRGEMGG